MQRRPYRKRRGRGCLPVIIGIIVVIAGTFLLSRLVTGVLSEDILQRLPGAGAITRLFSDDFVVAIDAGHGGNDPGAEGVIREADMTARTAEALYALLDADERFTPVYCHPLDEGANVLDRCKEASRTGADLLLSIHGNSDPGGNGHGYECYPAPPGRTYHADSLYFAQLLTAQIASTGINIRGDNGVRYAYYIDDVNKVIVESTDESVRSDGSFGIVDHAGCPSVLVEQCFVTNSEDAALLGGEEGCKLAAEAYYQAICEYYAAKNPE